MDQNQSQRPADPVPAADPPLNPDLAGYPSQEALVQGYRDLQAEASRRSIENADLKRLLDRPVADPRQAVPDRSNKPGWYQRLETLGVPPEDIREAVREEARSLVKEELQPIYQIGTARTEVLGKYPDYAKFEADIGAFVNSNPKIQERYAKAWAVDPGMAVEWAYHEFGAARRKVAPNGAAKADGAEHAAIPSQRVGEGRGQNFNADIGIEEARKLYEANPSRANAERYARERLHRVITDEHLHGPEK